MLQFDVSEGVPKEVGQCEGERSSVHRAEDGLEWLCIKQNASSMKGSQGPSFGNSH
jgi:hypothetical protein